MPTLVVDDAIVDRESFAALGRVVALPGRAIDAAAVRDADVLVTRSVTRVDAALVRGSRLSMVATATAGIDHVDVDALRDRDIAFASAAGCNARAVAEYVLAALAEVAAARGVTLADLRTPVGVVGFGHVGRRTTALLRTLGWTVLASDPPLAARRDDPTPIDFDESLDALARSEPLLPLEALTERCAVVTLHVPLTEAGPHATRALIDRAVLDRLPPDAVVLSTCRGNVLDEAALTPWLERGSRHAVLDVFAGEPSLDHPELLDHARVVLTTPHVAGYTHEGKHAATRLAAQAVARHLGVPDPAVATPPPGPPLELPAGSDPLGALLRAHADLAGDDAALRALAPLPPPARAARFEALRKGYRMRSEHAATVVRLDPTQAELGPMLEALGFSVAERPIG